MEPRKKKNMDTETTEQAKKERCYTKNENTEKESERRRVKMKKVNKGRQRRRHMAGGGNIN